MAFPFKLPLLLDGAAGTNLIAADMPQGVCVEDWVKENPQVMQRIQAAFLEAGADVLYAPTFGANREKLSHYLLEDQTQQINKALVSMTKETAESEALVAGDMSPTGLFVEPFGEASFKQLVKVYEEQAACLKKAGADLLVIETRPACRSLSPSPWMTTAAPSPDWMRAPHCSPCRRWAFRPSD